MEHVFILKVGVSLWRHEQLDNFCGPVLRPPGCFSTMDVTEIKNTSLRV